LQNGLFERLNPKTGFVENCYNGNMQITLNIYDKEKDGVNELIKKVYSED